MNKTLWKQSRSDYLEGGSGIRGGDTELSLGKLPGFLWKEDCNGSLKRARN